MTSSSCTCDQTLIQEQKNEVRRRCVSFQSETLVFEAASFHESLTSCLLFLLLYLGVTTSSISSCQRLCGAAASG